MNFEDILVDGVRMADTDFSKFTRLCHLTAWEDKAKDAARALFSDHDTLWKFGDYRRELEEVTRDRLIDASREREQNCKPRNLDLKVVRTFPKDWTADDIAGSPDACKIGLNDGRSPKEVVWADFHEPEEMTNYEFAAYAILGDEECNRQGIDTLYDMFGTEFANRFYKRKTQRNATKRLKELYRERAELNAQITELERQAQG